MKMANNQEMAARLGKYLKARRVIFGRTQKEVASTLGYTSPQFISNLERGICSPPLNLLKKLITLYKIDRKEILDLLLSEQEKFLKAELFAEQTTIPTNSPTNLAPSAPIVSKTPEATS